MRAPALALAPLEVAIRRAGASLARPQHVGIHCQAHAASRFAPLEAGFLKDAIEAETLGLPLDLLGTRHDHRVDRRRNLAALDDSGGGLEIADARVGA